MLSEKQVIDRIETIFKKEELDIIHNGFQPIIHIDTRSLNNSTNGSVPIGHTTVSASVPYEYNICRNVPNTYQVYENFELLNKLYSKISSNKKLKIVFMKWVLEHIETDKGAEHYFDEIGLIEPRMRRIYTAGLAFYFLFKIRELNLAEKAMQKRRSKKISSASIYKIIQNILIYDHHLMTEEDIECIQRIPYQISRFKINLGEYDIIGDDPSESEHNQMIWILNNLVHDLKTYRLEKELSDNINYEINQDKDKVQKYILYYGFDGVAAEALNKIDESYYDSSEESFDLRNAISLLKEVFDSVTESVLERLKQYTGKTPIKKDEKEHPTQTKHRFICEELSFTDGETNCMSSINKMLNEEKHSLMSKKEKYRITRNFTIEFLLILFSKLSQLERTVGRSIK